MSEEIVYHYTDGAGLLGILNNCELWCTQIDYMNDAQEWLYGQTIYQRALVALSRDETFEKRMREFADVAIYHDQSFAREHSKHERRNCFVASFSKAEDSLGQWRAYSKAGSRYAIGFRTNEIVKLLTDRPGRHRFEQVSYSEPAAIRRMQEFFVDAVKKGERDMYSGGDYKSRPASDAHAAAILEIGQQIRRNIGIFTKHEKFKEEEEWRLLSYAIPPNIVSSRPGNSYIVPFFKFSLRGSVSIIESIMCGPTAHPELSRESIEYLKDGQNGNWFQSADVRNSKIPYRDW